MRFGMAFSTMPSSSSSSGSVIGDTVLSFKNVNFEYMPLQPLLKNVSFNIREGAKVTIMGQNGSGKSTIMKLMNGYLKPQDGAINLKRNYALSRALQVIPIEDRDKTLREFFLDKLHGTTSGLDGRITSVLKQVNLDGIDFNRVMKSFSGGQQARLLLASSLILEPDILLLDEPTNNLDAKGITVLSDVIQNTKKTCVVISHDEDFLNSFTDAVLYVDTVAKKVEYYDGNYNDVKVAIKNRIERENAANARLAREIQQKRDQSAQFASKGGSNMRKMAKKLKESAEEKEKEIITSVRREDRTLKPFQIPYQQEYHNTNNVKSIGLKMMTISSISLPFSEKQLDFTLSPIYIEKGTHIRIAGPNGIGKTTFLESIVNQTAEGIHVNPLASIGYYRQDFHNLPMEKKVIEVLEAAANNKHSIQHIRSVAAQFFFRNQLIQQPVYTLSEGQKGLLSLAAIVLQEPAILILDEPTNHINFRHLPVLAEAFNRFDGAMLIVSHDSDFVDHLKIDLEINLAQHH
jgi:ATPase subunit of ABC transporter with duplicated ATPase domains